MVSELWVLKRPRLEHFTRNFRKTHQAFITASKKHFYHVKVNCEQAMLEKHPL